MQLAVRTDRKQSRLRYALGECCLIEPEVDTIRLIVVSAKFASVIF